jgi:NADPH2:quinone reductase
MHAITVSGYGAEPKLTEIADPQPGARQVLIKIEAAGINPMDRAIASGFFKAQMPATLPLILGADLAGIVEARGPGADTFLPGDKVFGQLLIVPLGSTGTYADRVAVADDAPLARIPKGLDPIVAAALPTAGATAMQIVESLEPLDGKTVLIAGAAGGIGSFATQLAANAGAHVIAVARAAAEERLRDYGVEEAIDYVSVSVLDAVRRTHPDGIDVLIDLANDADAFAKLASLVRQGGTALSTRYAADTKALASHGVTGINFALQISKGVLERLADAIVSGRIASPPITRIKLEDVPALRPNGDAGGKTVITL